MVLHGAGADRLERSRSDVEQDWYHGRAPRPYTVQQGRREMQSGRGRGHGAVFLRVDRLVAVPVLRVRRAAYVGRQRRAAHLLDDPGHVRVPAETDAAYLLPGAVLHGGGQDAALQVQARPFREPCARLQQDFPSVGRGFACLADQHDFNPPAGFRPHPPKPGGHHPRPVEHQRIGRGQVVDNIPESPVFDHAGAPVHHHQPGCVAGFGGILGDQLFRQGVVEFCYIPG